MPVYFETAPAAPLSAWVECGWCLESANGLNGHRVPPDGCIDIIYERGKGLHAIGAMTREQRFNYPGGAHLTGIRFRPGMARPFFGVAASELTDSSEPLDALAFSRGNELLRRLDDAKSIRDAMRVLLASIPRPECRPTPVQHAITAIAGRNGSVDLDCVARQANLSSRQFRRRCLEESGLAPKLLCRVLRFRHACRIARASARPDWAAVAVEAEYFDQPHFIRDFRLFTGLTPMAVFSNTPRPDPD